MSSVAVMRGWDRATWNELGGVDFRLLEELCFLSRCQARRGGTGAAYCMPSRRWLARRIGCAVVTVARHVARLQALGLIVRVQRRRSVDGVWRTNLYRVVAPAAWGIGRLRDLVRKSVHRVSHLTHKPAPAEQVSVGTGSKVAFGTLFDRWMSRGVT